MPSIATYIGLRVDGNYVGQNMSIRSEGGELYSELISTLVTLGEYYTHTVIASYTPFISYNVILHS